MEQTPHSNVHHEGARTGTWLDHANVLKGLRLPWPARRGWLGIIPNTKRQHAGAAGSIRVGTVQEAADPRFALHRCFSLPSPFLSLLRVNFKNIFKNSNY